MRNGCCRLSDEGERQRISSGFRTCLSIGGHLLQGHRSSLYSQGSEPLFSQESPSGDQIRVVLRPIRGRHLEASGVAYNINRPEEAGGTCRLPLHHR
jgi:hypothetical protein